MTKLLLGVAAGFMLAGSAQAVQLSTTVSASGPYQGDITVLNDNVVPLRGSSYSSNQTVHDYNNTTFTFSFGGLVTVTDLLASVDNNDDYTINFYNGATLAGTYFISSFAGTVNGGMDNFATFSAPDSSQLGTSFSYLATRAVVSTTGGDGLYGLGEVDFYNNTPTTTPSGVPEPASWAMMLGGFGAIGAGLRRRGRVAVSFG